MTSKRQSSSHLQYFWWVYVIIAVFVVFLWTTAFSAMAKPRDNEQVTVIFFDRAFEAETMNKVLEANISNVSEQSLKEITFGTADYGDEVTFMQQITSRLYVSDVIILPENIIKSEDIPAWFKPIPQDTAQKHFQNAELYLIDGEIYGVYVYSPNYDTLMSEHYSGEYRAVAFFSPQSENLGGIYDKGNAFDTAAFDVIAYILGGNENG